MLPSCVIPRAFSESLIKITRNERKGMKNSENGSKRGFQKEIDWDWLRFLQEQFRGASIIYGHLWWKLSICRTGPEGWHSTILEWHISWPNLLENAWLHPLRSSITARQTVSQPPDIYSEFLLEISTSPSNEKSISICCWYFASWICWCSHNSRSAAAKSYSSRLSQNSCFLHFTTTPHLPST